MLLQTSMKMWYMHSIKIPALLKKTVLCSVCKLWFLGMSLMASHVVLDSSIAVMMMKVTIKQTRTPESILAGFETKKYNLSQIYHERAKFIVQCSLNKRRMAQT